MSKLLPSAKPIEKSILWPPEHTQIGELHLKNSNNNAL